MSADYQPLEMLAQQTPSDANAQPTVYTRK